MQHPSHAARFVVRSPDKQHQRFKYQRQPRRKQVRDLRHHVEAIWDESEDDPTDPGHRCVTRSAFGLDEGAITANNKTEKESDSVYCQWS